MPRKPPRPSTGIELSFDLSSCCLQCGAEREPEGKRIMSSKGERGSTYIVEAPNPCDCGERRIKVSFEIEFS